MPIERADELAQGLEASIEKLQRFQKTVKARREAEAMQETESTRPPVQIIPTNPPSKG